MNISRRGIIAAILGVWVCITLQIPSAQADEFTDGAQKFISTLADRAQTSLLVNNITLKERQTRFRTLMLDTFDLNGVGKWVLGRYWRRASRQERQLYCLRWSE